MIFSEYFSLIFGNFTSLNAFLYVYTIYANQDIIIKIQPNPNYLTVCIVVQRSSRHFAGKIVKCRNLEWTVSVCSELLIIHFWRYACRSMHLRPSILFKYLNFNFFLINTIYVSININKNVKRISLRLIFTLKYIFKCVSGHFFFFEDLKEFKSRTFDRNTFHYLVWIIIKLISMYRFLNDLQQILMIAMYVVRSGSVERP